MQHRRFKALEIVSSRTPKDTHNIVQTTDDYLYILDSGNGNLYKSEDKGDNWSLITSVDVDLVGLLIDSGFLYVGERYSINLSRVKRITLSNDNITNSPGSGIPELVTMHDIYKSGSTLYMLSTFESGGNIFIGYFNTDFSGSGESIVTNMGAIAGRTYEISYISHIGIYLYFLWFWSNENVELWRHEVGTINFTQMDDFGANTDLPDSKNQWGIAYDGTDILYFVAKNTNDSKNYLYSYSISDDTLTKLGEYNVALMRERNTASGVLEKAFSIGASETVYELTTKRGGIRVLQDISDLTDAVIIAITDNFLMNDDGDMFEFTDVTNEISTILYNDGIVGILKKGTFTVHPDFHINWNKGDSIKIYDQYDQLEFHGLINDKNRNKRGIYIFKIDSFTNEIYRKTYSTTYSGDDLDTKQKDMIDNACDFCYRLASIVGTTTTFNYVYNRALIYLFWLGRQLERQVPYIEPDGKIWTKAHDGLVKNDMIYPGTYNFRDEADGTSGTDIDFVNSATTGANTTLQIIALHNGHRKVLDFYDNDGGARTEAFNNFASGQASGTIELFIEGDDVTDRFDIRLRDGGDDGPWLYIDIDNLRYFDGAGHVIVALSDALIYHFRIDFECGAGAYEGLAADTFYIWVNETRFGPYPFETAVDAIDRIYLRTDTADSGYHYYIDAIGYSWDPAYTVGDNEVAWDINNHWQDVQFIDIPGIEEMIQGFFDGNSGITRNTIRYRDNAQTIRPVAATRDPIEQLQGILPLNEFRDPKIEAATEADQLGDNRYAIWSADTIFIGLRVLGQGYLQPGKTIPLENTGQIIVAESNLLLLSFVRDPKNDVYSQMILSDNIIFPSEFTNLDNTSPQQIHTSVVQSFENQADIIAHLTPEGGLALRLTNKTGGASVKGTLVEADAVVNNAFDIADANSVECFGVVYEDGIADGLECLVVINGRCQVLLKDATLSTRHNWVMVSNVAGRADATNASPAAAPTHFKEIGHCIESKGADTDVLAFIMMHLL